MTQSTYESNEKILITSVAQFEQLLQNDHDTYQAIYTLSNGQVVSETMPFDKDDPMSYAMVTFLLPVPNFKLYQIKLR